MENRFRNGLIVSVCYGMGPYWQQVRQIDYINVQTGGTGRRGGRRRTEMKRIDEKPKMEEEGYTNGIYKDK